MASILYTSILNSFVSTEGSNGIMTNYIYYSVLVAYDNGTKEIVEDKLSRIRPLLAYARTPMDDLADIKTAVKGLREDMNSIIEEKINYVVDSLYPIPNIQDMNELEADKLICNNGLTPSYLYSYPDSIPKNGTVISYKRNQENFKLVEVDILHPMPDVKGLKQQDALLILKEAGFEVEIGHQVVSDVENGIVLSAFRSSSHSMNAKVVVSSSVPETTGMELTEATKLLQSMGYTVSMIERYSSTPKGLVDSWDSFGNNGIRLYSSLGNSRIEAKKIEMTWSNMSGSTGDHYKAQGIYYKDKSLLGLTITCTPGIKGKRSIIGVETQSGDGCSAHLCKGFSMNGADSVDLSIEVKMKTVPQNLRLALKTQYGSLVKKDEDILLGISFEW